MAPSRLPSDQLRPPTNYRSSHTSSPGWPFSTEAQPIASVSLICTAKRRPYSEPLDVDAALGELERHAGTQFDPEAVEALVSFVRCGEAVPA